MSTTRFKLPPEGSLVRIDSDDPLPHYYKGWGIGWLYCERIRKGLALLPDHVSAILDIGYGSGVVLPSLAERCTDLYGIDLHPRRQEVVDLLARLNVRPQLISANAKTLPFPEARFDAIVSFSFMEHVKPVGAFLDEMWRVLKPGGKIILGMPMVNKWFNALFPMIGVNNIEQHHITSPSEVQEEIRWRGWACNDSGMPDLLPTPLRIYTIFEITKGVPVQSSSEQSIPRLATSAAVRP